VECSCTSYRGMIRSNEGIVLDLTMKVVHGSEKLYCGFFIVRDRVRKEVYAS
jgi:hypothetical protein